MVQIEDRGPTSDSRVVGCAAKVTLVTAGASGSWFIACPPLPSMCNSQSVAIFCNRKLRLTLLVKSPHVITESYRSNPSLKTTLDTLEHSQCLETLTHFLVSRSRLLKSQSSSTSSAGPAGGSETKTRPRLQLEILTRCQPRAIKVQLHPVSVV